MNVGIVGCGFIGQKRAKALAGATLTAVADIDPTRAATLASSTGAQVCNSWQALVKRPDVDIVVVATTNNALAPVTLAAVEAGKHVLVEKPTARNAAELEPVMSAVPKQGVQVRVGFNHRYHPAFLKAQEIFSSGVLGEMMFIRGRYGHGGRVGYDQEWRADPELSGGGELLDQGVHLIDLARLFLGDFPQVQGFAHTYFWQMPVDDNGFMLLQTRQRQTAFLHVSWTEWKNLFSFEIYGRDAKLHIEGLGGSYGVERLTHYQMRPEMGPPDTTCWEYPGPDQSWEIEFREFLEDITQKRTPSANLNDAYAALQIVGEIYRGSV
jgi:predicted dehydrogenase